MGGQGGREMEGREEMSTHVRTHGNNLILDCGSRMDKLCGVGEVVHCSVEKSWIHRYLVFTTANNNNKNQEHLSQQQHQQQHQQQSRSHQYPCYHNH